MRALIELHRVGSAPIVERVDLIVGGVTQLTMDALPVPTAEIFSPKRDF